MHEMGSGQQQVSLLHKEVCFDVQAPDVRVHQNKTM